MENEKYFVTFVKYNIRRVFDEHNEKWCFSVIDLVAALIDSVNPRDYGYKMKTRVKTRDGFEQSTLCRQLILNNE